MKKDKIDFTKNPELFIGNEKIDFHYNRTDRLKLHHVEPKKSDSFFSKKNRFLHFIIIDLILIFLIGYIFYILNNDKQYRVIVDGMLYKFKKIGISKKNLIRFSFKVKNTTNKTKIIDQDEVKIIVKDTNGNKVYSNSFFLPKTNYKESEEYSENFVVDKPKKGTYSTTMIIGNDKRKSVSFKFKISR